MRRFFYDFQPQENIKFEGEQFVHLAFVLRAKIGDKIILTRNDEFDYIYEIVSIDKKYAELKFIEKNKNLCNPVLNVCLYVALEKGDKMEFVVQKSVELGVNAIVPLKTAFCQVKPSLIRIDRLQKIANESCKQCGRSKTALVKDVVDIKDLSWANNSDKLVCFLYEGESEISLLDYLNSVDKSKIKNVDIIIGSEGGFSDSEVRCFIERGIKPLTLGKRILRAETACVAVSAVVLAEFGELK